MWKDGLKEVGITFILQNASCANTSPTDQDLSAHYYKFGCLYYMALRFMHSHA